MSTRILYLCILAASMANGSLAYSIGTGDAKSSGARDQTSQKSRVMQPTRVPFSADLEKLAPHFSGDDCRAITRKVKSLNPGKSEFESSADYARRLAAFQQERIVGAGTLADLLGFVEAFPTVQSRYDADKGVMNVYAEWGTEKAYVGGSGYHASLVYDNETARSTYIGTNAFGAKVKVTRSDRTVCALAFRNAPYYGPDNGKISVTLNMPPDEAKATKDHLALLYVGVATVPYLAEFTNHIQATFDKPTEATWHGDSLVMTLGQVWLFNKSTGKIYEKVTISGLKEMEQEVRRDATALPVVGNGEYALTENCKPVWPRMSLANEESGTTTISFLVTADGKVVDSKIVRSSGFVNLDNAARDGLRRCTFRATVQEGKPIDSWVQVQYRWKND